MVNSDHSEEEDMETLNISSDSIQLTPTKRAHIDSEDEQDRPTKKRRYSASKESGTSETDNTEVTLDKNGIDKNSLNEKKDTSTENGSDQNEKSVFDSSLKIKNEEDEENKIVQTEIESTIKDVNSASTDESSMKIKPETAESKDSPFEQSSNMKVESTSDEKKNEDNAAKKQVESTDDSQENSEERKTKEKRTTKHRVIDTEVVDGLELSVECASDKEESSSESSDEKETKPRPKTMIVKAEPNESELECGSSDNEKSDALESNGAVIMKKSESKRGKRRSTRTSFSKLKTSGSEDSQNNNSDEDYSPRTKKKVKKSPTTKKPIKRSQESKRYRGRARKNSLKRNTENASDDENSDTVLMEKTDETKKNEVEEELSEKESSASKSDSESNSESEDKSKKGRKTRHSNSKPEDDKKIKSLKKYITKAGVKVKSYQELWAGCVNNRQRVNRLKELLEKNGVTGRPTLEKCKRAKMKNEKMQEISELDTSNIISEGRVTRARRNMETNKKSTIDGTPPRHREARSTFKRLQTVIDSDSE